MKRLIGLTLLNSNNVGETMVSPLDYFKFPIPSEKLCVTAYNPDDIRGQLIIHGGGGLIHLPSPDYNDGVMGYLEEICELGPWLISWGIGHNIHGATEIIYPKSFVEKYVLHGVRDFNQDILPTVPCASCMSTLFHHTYKIKQDVVVVGHDLEEVAGGKPFLPFNHYGVTAKEAVEFIASSETIVTNSYHGAYWGYLLNRKVVVCDPMSTKFYGLPKGIVLSSKTKWEKDMAQAKTNKSFLTACRKTNREYYKKVAAIVERFLNA